MAPNDVHSVSFPRGVTDTITNCFMISVQLQMQPCKGDWKPLFHSVMYPYMPVHEHTSPSAPDRLLMCTVNFHNVLKDVRNYFKRLLVITVFFYTDCRDSLKADLCFPPLSSNKTQNHSLQTCTIYLSLSKNTVQSHCILLLGRCKSKYCTSIPVLYVVFL